MNGAIFGLLFSAAASSVGAAAAQLPEVAYQVQIGISNAFETGGRAQKHELSFEPRIDVRFSSDVRLTAKALLRNDFADKLDPGKPSNDSRSPASGRVIAGTHADLELRELFVDFELGTTQVRLGKQQVVWGQADGLRILDVINPLSYREFILPDFEDRRIPLWMVNAELPLGDSTLQLLWILDQTYDEFPDAQGAYAFTAPRFRPAVAGGSAVDFVPARKPDNVLEDSDIGLRLSMFADGWDLTANYLYHYQDQPVLALEKSLAVTQVKPTYMRTHLAGATASKAFGDFVVRAEFGYSTDRFFVSSLAAGGVAKTDELAGVIGLDYSGFTDLLISGQFFFSSVGSDAGMLRPQRERNISLLIRRSFSNETLRAELLAIHNTNESDGLVQFELTYEFASDITLSAGVDIFYGPASGVFGQFDQRDRVSLQLEIGW